MAPAEIPEKVRNFIFMHLHSVDQLEIILLVRRDPAKSWTIKKLTDELRSNENLVSTRLAKLVALGLLERREGTDEYRYSPGDPLLEETINELAEVCRVQRHRVLELIFSPMKRARDFAEAFYIKDPNGDDKDDG